MQDGNIDKRQGINARYVSECRSIRQMVRLFEDTGSVVERRKGSGRKQVIYEKKMEVLKLKKKLQ